MWRKVRIAFLLVLLFVAAGVTWVDRVRTTAWDDTLWIGIFPLNGDGRQETAEFVAGVEPADFADIEDFFARQAEAHGIRLERPVRIDVHSGVTELPPRLDRDANVISRMWWSLRMRWYAWRQAGDTLADIRVFVLYNEPGKPVPHSVGLQRGLVGVVHAFAERAMTPANNVVIAHEILHTLGAVDKYDMASLAPLYPGGYAEPERDPLHPQAFTEIMAGRYALDEQTFEMPASLAEVVVGEETAGEIRWIRDP